MLKLRRTDYGLMELQRKIKIYARQKDESKL